MAKKDNVIRSMILTDRTYDYYWNRLVNISMSVFDWKNLPSTVDPRFLELTILRNGMCLFFKDEVMGYLALPCAIGGMLNVYNIPTYRRAYASNGYQAERNEEDSVIIYHDYLHSVPLWTIEMFAQRLTNYQQTIDINVYAQKTPILITCPKEQELSLRNLMDKYDENTPLIVADAKLNPNSVKALNIQANYVADDIEQLRTMVWNDFMTYIGISNVNVTKKERLITDEVQRNMGGTLASRFSPLEMRRQAADKINEIFGLNIEVDYREDILAYQTGIIGNTLEEFTDKDGDTSE